jgi:hypothetical protein
MPVDGLEKGRGRGRGKGKGQPKGGLPKGQRAPTPSPTPRGKGRGKEGKGQHQRPAGAQPPQGYQGRAGGQGEIQGFCGKCGRWGHKASVCRSASEVVSDPTEEAGGESGAGSSASYPPTAISGVLSGSVGESWVISSCLVGSVRGEFSPEAGTVHLLVDSGAEVHVAPPHFSKHIPLEAPAKRLRLQAVNGSELEHLGPRRVLLCLFPRGGAPRFATVVFQVAPVSRPVLSAVRLASCGFLSRFEAGSAHVQGPDGSLFDLDRRGQVYLLPARVLDRLPPKPLRSCLKQSNDRGRGKTRGLAPFTAGGSSGVPCSGGLPAKAAEEQEPREQRSQPSLRQQ